MPTTTGMKGGGFYDAHSAPQRVALEVYLPWLEAILVDLPQAPDGPSCLCILDIGSSEGGNAIYAMNRLIAKLRDTSDRPVCIWFDDLPTNDFNQLFANLFPAGKPALAADNVFPGVIGGSAFSRLMPPQALHLATTFNALGFLERKPDAPVPNYILPMGPGPSAPRAGVSVTEQEREPFRLQAEQDLHHFYQARAAELLPGGKLMVQVFGRDQRFSTSYGIYDVLNDAVLDFVEAGKLLRLVFEHLTFPIYFRTLEELLAPVKTDERLTQCFRIEQSESREVPVPFNLELAETGDVATWARSYTGFLRAFTEAILAAALPQGADNAEMVNQLYQRVEQRLAAEPTRYDFHYISIAALLTRR